MTHEGNLLAESGWKDIEWIQDLFKIHEGICYLEKEKCSTPKNAVVSRFNSNLFPSRNINQHLYIILKVLQHVNKNKTECKKYHQARQDWSRNKHGAEPVPPKCTELYQYFSRKS